MTVIRIEMQACEPALNRYHSWRVVAARTYSDIGMPGSPSGGSAAQDGPNGMT